MGMEKKQGWGWSREDGHRRDGDGKRIGTEQRTEYERRRDGVGAEMGMGKEWRWSREPLCRHTGLHLRAPSTLTWSTAGSESHHLPTDGTVTVAQ